MKTKKHNFKFGVRDYNKTYANHSAKLAKYREACKSEEVKKFTWDSDIEREAYEILDIPNYPFDGKCSPFLGLRSIRTAVNNYYISEINWYLEMNDLNKYWFTAVYLDNYNRLNQHMNKVANEVLNEVSLNNAKK